MSISFNVSESDSTLTTNGASWQTLHTVGMPVTACAQVDFYVQARESGGTDIKIWRKTVAVRREDTGDPVIVGSILDLIQPTGTLGALLWNVDIDIDGSNIRCRVYGQSGDVYWSSHAVAAVMEIV